MNIVVAGGGEISLRIAEQLMAAHNVVCIGARDRDRARLERLEIETVDGLLTSPAVLNAARVRDADVYIAASHEDEKNIVSCVAARRLGARQVLCFLSRRGFFTIDSDEDALAESLGIDAIIRPAAQLAEEIVRIVTVPGALDVRAFAGGRVHLEKFEIDQNSPLAGGSLAEIDVPTGVIAVMGQRGDEFFIPRGATRFEPGDRVTVMGTPKGIRRLHRSIQDQRSRRGRRRAVIIGGGLVGGAVAEGLTEAGWSVKVIEFDRQRCRDLAAQLDCLVLHGDGTDLDLLEQELVDEPDALVAVTSNDEKNLLISLLGQHLAVPRVITRADRLINERIFEKVGVDVVLSAKGAAIRRVVSDFIEADRQHIAELEHGDFTVLDVELPASFEPTEVKDFQFPVFAIIGAILRDRRATIPTGGTVLQPGDHLIVVCDHERETELLAACGSARSIAVVS